MRLMVVEDDSTLRTVLTTYFRSTGIDVMASPTDGQEALELLVSIHPDVILTDCQMPRLDGIALVRMLRARGDQTPVVMMSGQTDPHIRDRALAAGVCHYLSKPLTLRSLQSVLDQTISGTAA